MCVCKGTSCPLLSRSAAHSACLSGSSRCAAGLYAVTGPTEPLTFPHPRRSTPFTCCCTRSRPCTCSPGSTLASVSSKSTSPCGILQPLLLCIWLISFNVLSSVFTHVVTNDRISFFSETDKYSKRRGHRCATSSVFHDIRELVLKCLRTWGGAPAALSTL